MLRRALALVPLAVLSACAGTTGAPAPAGPPSSPATSRPASSVSPSATASANTRPSASRPAPDEKVDCTKLKCIALTYDDGPSPLTPKLLKAFTERKATATLFMLGNAAETYPATVRQAHAQGFEIGNHTYDHKPINELPDAKVAWEVGKTNDVLARLTGQRPTVMRPPYAARTKRTDAVVGKQGQSVIVWHNSPEDWAPGHNTAAIITRLTLERATPGSIILMHDIHSWTVDAAPAIIDGLQKKGYTLVTVSQLLGQTKPGVLYPR